MKNKHSLFTMTGFAIFAFILIFTTCHHPTDPTLTTYSIHYDGNGNTGGSVPASQSYTLGQQTIVLGNTGGLVKTGKVFDGWNTNAAGTGAWYPVGARISMRSNVTLYAFWQNPLGADERRFSAIKITDDSWYSLTAKKVGESTHCIVYADITTGITTSEGQAVTAQYESAIHNQITGTFGGIEDVDGNNKVIFLMLDIIDGYTGSGGYVAGFFQEYQMYSRSAGAAYSNEADMLFMDTNPGFNSGNTAVMQTFYSTMAHELQHLIEFSETVAKGKAEKDLWINEGLSTGAEYIYGTGTGSPAQQTSRIDYFNAPGTTIPYGNNFFVWSGYWEQVYGDVLANYATAYLFFQWLRIHASNGTGIYKDIIASPYADYRAVTTAASSKIDSSLSAWGTLLGKWLLANAVNSSTGPLGYQNQITTTTYRLSGSTQWPLSPGEGVFSSISGGSVSTAGFSSGSHIKYVGIGTGGSLDETGSAYTGSYLLTFNTNSNKGGADENGKLAASIASGPQASVQMSLNGNAVPALSAPLPTSYPIDVHFGPDGTVSPDSPRAGASKPGKGITAKPLGSGK
ncbi:InlB B-repeat-containing protein [Breznakiellaceae bacterium SP9]